MNATVAAPNHETTDSAAVLTVGGQANDLVAGVVLTGLGGLIAVPSIPALITHFSIIGLVLASLFGAATLYGLYLLLIRARVEVGRDGSATRTHTVLGAPLRTTDYAAESFDFVAVHDVRNDRWTRTGLKQMIKDMMSPQFQVSILGANDEVYLGMWWSHASAMEAASEIAAKTGLDTFDKTQGA